MFPFPDAHMDVHNKPLSPVEALTMLKTATRRAAEQAQPAVPLAVGISEACKITSLSRSRLYSELRSGNLKACKSGRRTLIAMSELSRWLAALPTT
jgi:excisionase family DNA binding protein